MLGSAYSPILNPNPYPKAQSLKPIPLLTHLVNCDILAKRNKRTSRKFYERMWRNWYTRTLEVRVDLSLGVRVSPSA